jgi:hypothetical protein
MCLNMKLVGERKYLKRPRRQIICTVLHFVYPELGDVEEPSGQRGQLRLPDTLA